MPVSDLPQLAQAMYSTWWNAMMGWASQIDPATGRGYSLTDVSAASAELSRNYPGTLKNYSPIGTSQLFSAARRIVNASAALTAAPDSSPISGSMVTEPPWSRPAADQFATPAWQARMNITYLDAQGVQTTGIAVVDIRQVLPASAGSLRAQMALRVQDQLATPPPTGTPRTGTLLSIDQISLLQV